METRRWLNQSQPQTLMFAVLLFYIDAGFMVLNVLLGGISLFGLAFIAGSVAAGYGIANERKWGYYLGILVSGLWILVLLSFGGLSLNLISLAFAIGRFVLLVHPQSRDYQRIWFK
jgi:hypothetical protein